jgi:regulator of telomere elongation helicase 1
MIISYWCLDPSVTFAEIKKLNPRSIILTSGTLTPLNSFEMELKVDFKVRLINKHIINPKEQVKDLENLFP